MPVQSRQRYRTVVPLEYPTDATVIRRLKAGEKLGYGQRGNKRVEAGRIVSDLPRESVPVLLRKGWIVAVDDPEKEADD